MEGKPTVDYVIDKLIASGKGDSEDKFYKSLKTCEYEQKQMESTLNNFIKVNNLDRPPSPFSNLTVDDLFG